MDKMFALPSEFNYNVRRIIRSVAVQGKLNDMYTSPSLCARGKFSASVMFAVQLARIAYA